MNDDSKRPSAIRIAHLPESGLRVASNISIELRFQNLDLMALLNQFEGRSSEWGTVGTLPSPRISENGSNEDGQGRLALDE